MNDMKMNTLRAFLALALSALSTQHPALAQPALAQPAPTSGCERCHKSIEPMHASPAVHLACVDCHGGDASATEKQSAHVKPLHPETWTTSANPERTYTALLKES